MNKQTHQLKRVFSETPLHHYGPDDIIALSSEERHHLFNVRRCRNEEEVQVLDGEGLLAMASCHSNEIKFLRLESSIKKQKPDIHLYAGLIKLDPWEWLLEKCTELAVHTIHPLKTQYVEPHLAEMAKQKHQRQKKICIDALKQSGNLFLPKISNIMTLKETVTKLSSPATYCLVAAEPRLIPSATPLRWDTFTLKSADSVHLFVGPEGGWGPEDWEVLKTLAPTYLTVPNQIFRAETSSLFFVSNILYSTIDGP